MKLFLAVCLLVGSGVPAVSQSLHFVADGRLPYQEVASSVFGRILEPRIDVFRSKRDWDEYFSAQSGFFGGPAVTTLIQPDFCREQVVALCLGNAGTFGQAPAIREVRAWDDETWEVIVDLQTFAKDQTSGGNMYSPYVAVRTPLGPNNYRFVFLSPEGRQVVDLRSPSYCLPREWWRCQDRKRGDR